MSDENTLASPAAPAQVLHSVEHWEQLAGEPAEDDSADDDSALGSNPAESTQSITSSILQYRTINGRTFHSERGNARYWASNDEQQNESMDIVHHFLSLVFDNKLYLSPLKEDIQKVVDIGTGTGTTAQNCHMMNEKADLFELVGIWAIDFADEFPNAEVIGTDISPIQPSWVPPNLKFIKDWSFLIKQAYKACKPGGWTESLEASAMMESDDGTVTKSSAMAEWGRFFIEGRKKMGQTFTILEDDLQRKYMKEAGFINIHIDNRKVPISGWPQDPRKKEIGQFVHAALEQDLEGYILYMASQLLGWTMDEVRVYCVQLRRELRNTKRYHPYYWVRKVYAQKPET
ncbi:methyltransferase [Fusarium albosuccineum]|uniref:Methyltransferase n=1 Tax=Fusarium albosuccineum TaxID=1237068 RepID=A0A8H4LC91_9HYPO|nr:methyltransferase [Fusarium albosuccineum]